MRDFDIDRASWALHGDEKLYDHHPGWICALPKGYVLLPNRSLGVREPLSADISGSAVGFKMTARGESLLGVASSRPSWATNDPVFGLGFALQGTELGLD
ncbi:MAG TPA: hypothetical protein VIS99_00095 [Terrimicrobiaceae bacterium]